MITDDEARELWRWANRLTTQAEDLKAQSARLREQVVTDLESRGLGARKIAQVLEVANHQQVERISERARKRRDQ